MPYGPDHDRGFWRGVQYALLDLGGYLIRRILIAAGIGVAVGAYGFAAMGVDLATAFGIFAVTTVIVLIVWFSIHSFFV